MFQGRITAVLISSCILAVACGESGSEKKIEPKDPKLAPIVVRHNSDGAPAGLPGCLNSGLYISGSHRVVTDHTVRRTITIAGALESETVDLQTQDLTYEFAFGDSSDANYVVKNISGAPISQYRIVNNNLVELGIYRTATGFAVHAEPRTIYFDLKEGETRRSEQNVQTNAMDQSGNFLLADTDFDYTYLGREEISVGPDQIVFKTCRVEVKAAEYEPFELRTTFWYSLGSGIPIRSSSYSDDPFDPRGKIEFRTTKEFVEATIDDIPITP